MRGIIRGLRYAGAAVLAATLIGVPITAMAAGLRIASLDECADQYVLGLMPADQIAAVSDGAGRLDSYYADRARSFARVRPGIESLLALHPDAVVRTWGGDAKLLEALKKHGINIININDVNSLPQARDELLRVGHALGQDAQAAAEVRAMMASLAGIRAIGKDKTVL